MDGQWAVTRSMPMPDVIGQSAAVAHPTWYHHPAYQMDMIGEMLQMLLLFTERCACLWRSSSRLAKVHPFPDYGPMLTAQW
jgi:hypothetical protein